MTSLEKDDEQTTNMQLSQLKNIMNKNYNNTAGYIKQILKAGYEINSSIKSTPHLESKEPKLIGCTALHLAFMENCIEGFETLLEAGADYTIKNRDGLTVLHQILEDFYKNDSMLRLNSEFSTLIMSNHLKNITNPCTSYGLSHFHAACLCNNAELVKLFLENDVASVNNAVKMDSLIFPGYTPLHFAVRSYGFETVQVLLDKGANQHLKNAEGKNPLFLLTEQNFKLMSSLKTDTMVPDGQIVCAVNEHERITNLLYLSNNNVCINFSAFHLACIMRDPSMLRGMLESDVDINLKVDQDSPFQPGFTGLHLAALCNVENMVLLLEKGADIEVKNTEGMTAFDICLDNYPVEQIKRILPSVNIWKDIVLSDNETTLLDLVDAMQTSEQLEAFFESSAARATAVIPTDSVLWPGFTVLHVAVRLFSPDLGTVNACLKAGADVTVQSVDGSTALHLAFRLELDDIVDLLLQHHHQQQVNLADNENLSILHIACARSGQEEFVKNLLQSEIDVNVAYKGRHIGSSFRSGFTPLHVAVASGNDKLVRELLAHGADRYAPDSQGFTPIHWVLAAPDPDIVEAELLVSVEDVTESIVSGLSHLHVVSYAKTFKYFDDYKYVDNDKLVMKFLAMPDAKIDVAVLYDEKSSPAFMAELAGATPFLLAMQKKKWDTAMELAQSGCDIFVKQRDGSVLFYDTLKQVEWADSRDLLSMLKSNEEALRREEEDIGLTRLHLACYSKDIKAIECLLKNGDDPNARIHVSSPLWPGYTPLHLLVKYDADDGYQLEVELLLRKLKLDFDRGLTNADGDTAAHLAYKHQRRHWLEYLFRKHLYYNANPTNHAGLSYFHMACSVLDIYKVEKFLEGRVAQVDSSIDPFCEAKLAGQTPLHLALNPKHFYSEDYCLSRMVDLLLHHGARVEAKDAFGRSPLHKAVELGKAKFDVLEKIIEAGADVNALDVFGTNPWDLLLSRGAFSAEQLKLFIERGCRLNGVNTVHEEGYASLTFCNHGGESEEKMALFHAMLKHPQAIDTDDRGCTVLHSFVANSETKLSCDEYANLVEQLVKLPDTVCDIDDQDEDGTTALHVAASYGNHSAIGGLLITGADVNVTDNDGFSVFDYVCEEDSDDESMAIATHVRKLEWLGLRATEENRHFAARTFEKLDFDDAVLGELVKRTFELAKSVEIPLGSLILNLRDFLTETFSDKTINAVMGKQTGTLIKLFFRDFEDTRFATLRSLLKLQYRKAAARSDLIGRASEAFDRLSRCTVACAELVAKFLANDDLKNLIEARKTIDD